MKTKISFVPDMASPVQPYFLWSLLGVGGFRGPMFRCFGKERQSFQLQAMNGGGAQRWLLFLSQHIYIQVGKDTNFSDIFPIFAAQISSPTSEVHCLLPTRLWTL